MHKYIKCSFLRLCDIACGHYTIMGLLLNPVASYRSGRQLPVSWVCFTQYTVATVWSDVYYFIRSPVTGHGSILLSGRQLPVSFSAGATCVDHNLNRKLLHAISVQGSKEQTFSPWFSLQLCRYYNCSWQVIFTLCLMTWYFYPMQILLNYLLVIYDICMLSLQTH